MGSLVEIIKRKRFFAVLLTAALLVMSASFAFAATEDNIYIKDGEVKDRDFYATGGNITSDGIIKGDFVAGGQTVISNGNVEGDIIAGANELIIGGDVLGDVRAIGNNVIVKGNIHKNANLLATVVDMQKGSTVDGNLYLYTGNANVANTVKGDLHVYGGVIRISGEIFGDVEVFLEDSSNDDAVSSLIVQSGTIIHGKLIYHSEKKASIAPGAQIGNIDFVRPQPGTGNDKTTGNYLLRFIKVMVSTTLFFAFALIFLKLFPRQFESQSSFIEKSPLVTFGVGIVAAISIGAIAVIIIGLLIFSFIVLDWSLFAIFSMVSMALYWLMIYFSTIPVSIWIGNRLMQPSVKFIYRFMLGLGVYTLGMFALELLGEIPVMGILFSILHSLVGVIGVIIGAGALLFAIREAYIQYRNGYNDNTLKKEDAI